MIGQEFELAHPHHLPFGRGRSPTILHSVAPIHYTISIYVVCVVKMFLVWYKALKYKLNCLSIFQYLETASKDDDFSRLCVISPWIYVHKK